MSALVDVFDVTEMFSLIISHYVSDPDPKVMLVRAFRVLLVDQMFMRAATAVIVNVFNRCERGMNGLYHAIGAFLRDAPNQCKYDAVLAQLEWAGRLYHTICFTQGSMPALAGLHFEQLLMYRHPETINELMHMLHGNCLCCGGQCASPEHQNRAWMQHPYKGPVTLCHTDTQCGCHRYILHGTWLPSTNPDELCEVAFACTEEEEYRATLRVDTHFTATDKMFLKFLRAAKRKPWYATNIARLFGLRPRRLFPCEHQPLRFRRNTSFIVNLPLLQPVVDLGEDASLAQVFGLTNKQMAKLIRAGGRMMHEERCLDADFDEVLVK
tara:strand:+ start:404 stop:1378 length:975 start_codon:yes stop_codon:yes gene_type:complete